jgi:hypothetical protein
LKLIEGYYDDLPFDEEKVDLPNKPDTSTLDAIYEIQHREKDDAEYYMQ